MGQEEEEKISLKEERIRRVAVSYYLRQDIRKSIVEFAQNREVVPRYFENFGKRPDTLQFEADVFELAKKGATSFHCSEELWKDPLGISTGAAPEKLGEMRTGWDLLIDIDCKWFDYSKKAAISIIKALEYSGVENIGIKFSGSKGFHIIVPWSAFPREFRGKQTKNMFPEWPRAIVSYLKYLSRPVLKELIKDIESDFKDMEGFVGVKCNRCNNLAEKGNQIAVKCQRCSHAESFISFEKEHKEKRCPQCIGALKETGRREFYRCASCSLNSINNPANFNKEIRETDIFKILGLDIVLVSPRHLFRMPYSLHEKTALASIVIDKNKIAEFDIRDADPMKIAPKNFIPECGEAEAAGLLLQALDYQQEEQKSSAGSHEAGSFLSRQNRQDFKEIVIKDLTPELYPPSIKAILAGMKTDGRKRALFILLNFFKSLKLEQDRIEKAVEEWNSKNYKPLEQGYVKSQLAWHARSPAILPPNFDKPHYREIGIIPTQEELSAKNPVSYAIRKSLSLQNQQAGQKGFKNKGIQK